MKQNNPILWQPTKQYISDSNIRNFSEYVNSCLNKKFSDYNELYEWSIQNISQFWSVFWDYSKIIHSVSYTDVLIDQDKIPGKRWFAGARMNFAENLLRFRDHRIAIHFYGEDVIRSSLTYKELYDNVSQLAFSMKKLGVKKGDRVAGFLPNMPETVVAMLATASIGAVWSSSSPDFGVNGVLDRFMQIKPKLIFASDGYFYKNKKHQLFDKLTEILSQLSSVEKVVIVNYVGIPIPNEIDLATTWDEFIDTTPRKLEFEQLPFDHPLYIMYSSGTTGKPKSIVHSAGGTLIQHLKELVLHTDLKRDDTIFYYTTCGWMMWNWLVSSFAIGSTVVLYDGNPFYPDAAALLKMADNLKISVFGTSAKYITALEENGVHPKEISTFPHLRVILSTGSPLVDVNFDFIYNHWKSNVQLSSISGGTDIISCFVLGNPTLPVYRGEIQCRGLGMAVASFDEMGNERIGEKGELVCTKPFPSMPIYFWNDPDESKYYRSYFNVFQDVWRHGDYITINNYGGIQIFGRSDATLNPGGVRIGTSEIYSIVEKFPEIADSLVVGQQWNGDERVVLFIKFMDGTEFTDDLMNNIKGTIRQHCSPRHVPSKIISIPDIPYTINGKKVEIAIKKIIHGENISNRDSLVNPDSLEHYRNLEELLY